MTVEKTVPVAVEVERCPLELPTLPPAPRRELVVCADRMGEGWVCYSPSEAHRLAALIDTLADLFEDLRRCKKAAPPAPAPAS